MSTETLRALHDKRTRGLPLSADEQATLHAWYAKQDDEERTLLAGKPEFERVHALRAQVQVANAELFTATQRIQSMSAENLQLREEIIRLQGQVTRGSKVQPA